MIVHNWSTVDIHVEHLRFSQETELGPGLAGPLKRVYEASFPPSEQVDFAGFIENIRRGTEQLFVAWMAGRPVGFALTMRLVGVDAYLMGYIAVDERARNRGIGGKLLVFLTSVLAGSGDASGIIFEAEAVDYGRPEERALRKRRIDFYKRHGASLIECAPNYRGPDLSGPGEVHYALMWIPFAENKEVPTGQHLRDLVRVLLVQGYGLEDSAPFVKAVLDDLVC
ncbi:MAG: GNAT family N-acetyltransferase [Anaerolineae bacterium]|nr:GNAT family N-acetyltransferase [Anaerolineae bacterium]